MIAAQPHGRNGRRQHDSNYTHGDPNNFGSLAFESVSWRDLAALLSAVKIDSTDIHAWSVLHNSSDAAFSSEHRLMAAVLLQAWKDLRLAEKPLVRRGAMEWLGDSASTWLYSFQNICDVFGLDRESVRRIFLTREPTYYSVA